ncbi:SOS response-associated protein YedK [Anaerolineae bacterium]|nr:SOS response-associated protein YedK [Anaerolineae bacterium]
MCGRFPEKETPAQLLQVFAEDGSVVWEYDQRINVAPGMRIPILEHTDTGNRIVPARWGFIPSWSKEIHPKTQPINARCETVATSGLFRADFKRHRTVTETDGFFEWKTIPGEKRKRPYWIRRRDRRATLIAALYGLRPDVQDSDECTTALITTEANELVGMIHDRMPVVIEPDNVPEWLDAGRTPEQLARFFRPRPSDEWEAVPIGYDVSNARNQHPSLEAVGEILRG